MKDDGETVRLQATEIAKVDEFEYLKSTVQSKERCKEGSSGWMEWMERGGKRYLREECVIKR